MHTLPKYHFLTIRQQKILLIMENNGKKITFSEQDVFKNARAFKRAMKQLANANFVIVNIFNHRNQYKLTLNGELITQEVIKYFIKNNS